ncbi:hypothetical protein Cni_G28006 [Canna indica]|uniref:Chlororespiratory reduction 4 n=1 Tax=Canna indica TaxID=4628 RepID=A0AAQ3L2R3_9LILI|nr:hypothetical protein Cni_G28006 [Canna indica]
MKHCNSFVRRSLLRSKFHLFLLRSVSSLPPSPSPSPSNPSSTPTTISFPFPSDRSRNQLVSSIGLTRGVDEARSLFDRMPRPDLATYSSMINLYLKDDRLPQAEALFRRMPQWNVVVASAMIDGYAKAGRVDEAQRVFDAMTERNVVSWTSLLSGYCLIGRIDEARQLFDRMPVRNVVSWTTMVLGYARSGLMMDARKLFEQMPERNVVAWTAMVKGHIENGRIDDARALFDRMPDRNVYSWNVMISGYLDCEQVGEAIRLFQLMPHKNAVSWTTMVSGMARNGWTEKARELFEQMPMKDTVAWNAMITAYSDEGFVSKARALFDLMPKRNIVTWNAMINGYAKNGCQDEALRLFISMLLLPVKPNESTLTSILSNCDSNIEVREIHGLADKLGFNSNTSFTNALMKMYSRSGDLNSAWQAFDGLQAKDIISWTSMIDAFSNHGCGGHALQVFSQMLRHGIRPDCKTFLAVLSACSHSGLVEKGKKIFNSMSIIYGLEPTAEHYSCLVDLLGRAGRIEEAKATIAKMPASEKDGAVLGALLCACRLHDQIAVACNVGEELIELDPSGSGGYVLLANMYASMGMWNDSARVRKMMKERRVKKVPGVSQIEVNMRNHVFFAGDQAHPRVKEIYVMLEEVLLPQMKDMGYLQVTCHSPISCFVEPLVISDPT